ncbi:MAG: hypothetical protein CVV64_07675 [Candidatus Wallbacteria bacterium HGW-Wallbacteria-1]|jgi:putative ATPase|uniref:AAA+ ATPase domain-containing protein n=1 Tax=Candidatus Wallbacteria bacterium HGW-Wallbacteria-1 TaxID=2013854 RepID=A0A2N1PQY5_9BACT|nr:MAG: hypothetical protein CVV64_07675 [Candidatus Wallbacteria bacterium HGW-Wallbacteria-1]
MGLFDDYSQEENPENSPFQKIAPNTSSASGDAPLAERARPRTLDEFAGQIHVIGPGKALREQIESDRIGSMIFYGPAGTGKTTLARIIAGMTSRQFKQLNAVTARVQDVRDCVQEARRIRGLLGKGYMLFIDEIHRFNKAQQDSLLPAVERGELILIGATTENPYFSIVSPLLSRLTVYCFDKLDDEQVYARLKKVISESLLGLDAEISEEALALIVTGSSGDMRVALNILERSFDYIANGDSNKAGPLRARVEKEHVQEVAQMKFLRYDRNAEGHYDNISAFIKSMRGSDPDAALLYLARMIASGEDPLFIARRIVIAAAEDVGLADPMALVVANSAFESVHRIGYPEARIILAEAALYIACAPKSNSAYKAVDMALQYVREGADQSVPTHLRSTPRTNFKGAEGQHGTAEPYLYPHDYSDGFVEQAYSARHVNFYRPVDRGHEAKFRARIQRLWKNRDY